MRFVPSSWLYAICIALFPAVLAAADGNPALLEIRVLEGDGASYVVGSRATKGVTVAVTDEVGKPVDGAIVSYSLPSSGPSGTFTSGARTEIISTKADGRAVVWGMQWNNTAGPVEMRITAVKGPARAGTLTTLYLTSNLAKSTAALSPDPNIDTKLRPTETAPAGKTKVTSGGHKWLWITIAVAGVAAAGFAIASGGGSSPSSAAPAATGVQIGTPTISLGRP